MEYLPPFVINIVGPESSGKTTLSRQWAETLACEWVPEYAREYLEGLERPYTLEDLHTIAEGQWERIQSAVDSRPPVQNSGQLGEGSGELKVTRELLSLSDLNQVVQSFLHHESPSGNVGASAMQANRFVSYQRVAFGDQPRPVVIIDSGMLSIRMWARIKYGSTIPLAEDCLANDMTSLYLLMRPLPDWEPDPLREAPSLLERAWIYNLYAAELASMMLTRR